MKSIILMFLLSSLSAYIVNPKECVIIPNKGVNSIVVDSSTFNDVKKEFGDIKKRKYWVKSQELELFGRFVHYLEYESIGVFSTSINFRSKPIISKIHLTSQCQCKTKNGIGIGSSYNDIINEFGKGTRWNLFGYKGAKVVELSYDNMHIIFDGNDIEKSVVIEIIIW